MRSRHGAARSQPTLPTSSAEGQPTETVDDDEKKKQQPPARKSKFRLPPPPKLLSSGNGRHAAASAPEQSDTVKKSGPSSSMDEETGASESALGPPPHNVVLTQLPPPPSFPIPSSQPNNEPMTSAYQRKHSSSTTVSRTVPTGERDDSDASNTISMITSRPSSAYSNPYQTSYKPNARYSDSRRIQKTQQLLQNAFIILVAFISLALLGWNMHHLHKEESRHHKHHNYHHHDRKKKLNDHNHLHAMIGIIDNPAGFALYSSPIHEKHKEQQEELFSRVPTIQLSNNRLLPRVGFGVAGRHIEHKEVPLIVSRLLQFASSENEGGGGIAMIDAVVDEDASKEEEKLESSMSKTVIALVGRAIGFFVKQSGRVVNGDGTILSDSNSYDYKNRLEVHILIGLTGPELGRENTIKALGDLTAELDGLVPPVHYLEDNVNASTWKSNAADRRVDTRLHVLLRLPECYNDIHRVVPCALDEKTNAGLIQSWIDSWGALERLYEADIIHGIGVDGTAEADLKLLLDHCKIAPQMYRGDVSQALDGYGRKMGVHSISDYHHVETLLKENNITFLASNVAGHVLEKKDQAPNAYSLMQVLGKMLFYSHRELLASRNGALQPSTGSEVDYYSVPRLALAYLVRHGVVALPHAYKPEHLVDDSPESVGGLADFLTERRVAEIGTALKALVTGRDLDSDHGLGTDDEDAVAAVFHNEMDEDVEIVRHFASDSHYSGDGVIGKGDSNVFTAQIGDQFEVYHHGRIIGKHQITAGKGGADDFTISESTLSM